MKKGLGLGIKPVVRRLLNRIRVQNKTKIFCIGRNKTGTTSFKRAMEDLGFVVGNQREAEKLFYQYRDGNFEPIIDYCKTAQVFQDFPFSARDTYKHIDRAFPGSKFILTVRDTPEQWYNSLVSFHAKLWGNGNVPTKEDLQNATYIWKGRPWETNRLMKTPEDDPYNKEILINSYCRYNEEVVSYFKSRPEDLLVINIASKGSYRKMIKFLGIESPFDDFPWENKTASIINQNED